MHMVSMANCTCGSLGTIAISVICARNLDLVSREQVSGWPTSLTTDSEVSHCLHALALLRECNCMNMCVCAYTKPWLSLGHLNTRKAGVIN